jgi:hypothetical protein
MAEAKALSFDSEIDDLEFKVVPEGDYRFIVDHYEEDYYQPREGGKIPPCPMAVVYLQVPFLDERNTPQYVTMKTQLRLASNQMFNIRRFFESIGLMKEGSGKQKMMWSEINGKIGCAKITATISNNGNEYNNVDSFYPPSKAPLVCDNDNAFQALRSFRPVENTSELPYS